MRSALLGTILLAIGCGDSTDPSATEGRLGGPCTAEGTCASAALRCAAGNVCGWGYQNPGNVGFEGGPCIDARSCTGNLECMGPVCGGLEPDPNGVTIDQPSGAVRLAWSPFRAAVVFVVRESEPRTIVWGVRAEDGLDSPLTFGAVPDGGEQLGSEATLALGTTYRAVVVRFDGTEAGAATIYDTFTP